MITTDFPNHKGMNVIGLLWLFVDTPHTKLMEQLKNVPSMFHQNFRFLKTKNPCKYLSCRDLFRRVPGGTRTHDIQNHNLTL